MNECSYQICSFSIKLDLNAWSLIHQILINTPSQNIAQSLPYQPRCESSEIPNRSIIFIDLIDSLQNTLVVLSDIFIIMLEEYSCSDDIQRMCNGTTQEVRSNWSQSWNHSNIKSSLFMMFVLRIKLEESIIELLAVLINRKEYPREGNISQKRHFQSSEEPTQSFLSIDLGRRIKEIIILLKSQDF